jgi:hypothetical protein
MTFVTTRKITDQIGNNWQGGTLDAWYVPVITLSVHVLIYSLLFHKDKMGPDIIKKSVKLISGVKEH